MIGVAQQDAQLRKAMDHLPELRSQLVIIH
jgi:hypothetical protein